MLTVTPLYASILAALIIFLAYRVTGFRQRESIGLGDDQCTEAMKRAIRVHANAIENIPMALILLLLLELNSLTPWLLHLFGSTLVAGRFFHAWGMSQDSGASRGRFHGTALTWLCMAAMLVVNVLIVLTRS